MKMKIFNLGKDKIEKIINHWLLKNKDIQLIYVTQTESFRGVWSEVFITLTIFYH